MNSKSLPHKLTKKIVSRLFQSFDTYMNLQGQTKTNVSHFSSLSIHLSIHEFNIYILCAYYVLGFPPGSGDIAVKKQEKINPASCGAYILVKERQ